MSFWGLILEPKKSYTQRGVEQPFHVSSASLDLQTADNEPVSVVCRKSDQDFILCSLSKQQGLYNVPLNLDFELGSEITFHVIGNSTVHLTGYIVDEMEFDDDDDSSLDELEEEEADDKVLLKNTKKLLDAAGKRKPDNSAQNKSKKAKVEVNQDEDDDEEDDSDFDMDQSMGGEEDLGEEEEEDEEDDDDDEDDDDEDEDDEDEGNDAEAAEVLKKLQAMKEGKSKQQGKNQQAAKASPTKGDQNAKQGKKEQAKGQNQPTKQNGAQSNGVAKKVIAGGIQVEDMHLGNGPVAGKGKQVAVYYVGRLKSTNKQFDACQSGKGFSFRLGKGEVITGWDLGVAGMKVGGKRRLTIPPKMAYGKEGSGKVIPPNSTLVFDVELRHVK